MKRALMLAGVACLAIACSRDRPPRYAHASTCGYAPYPPCSLPASPPPAAPTPPPASGQVQAPVNPLGWLAGWTAQLPEVPGLPALQVPRTSPSPTTDWPADWQSFEDQVLVETNLRRAQGAQCGEKSMPPAPPLTFNAQLRAAARRHASDLAEHDFISHIGSDGSRPEQRIRDAGYRTKKVIGENAAVGYPTPKIVVDEWMTSRGHCIDIMYKGFVHLGVGFVYRGNSSNQEFWVQNFGGG